MGAQGVDGAVRRRHRKLIGLCDPAVGSVPPSRLLQTGSALDIEVAHQRPAVVADFARRPDVGLGRDIGIHAQRGDFTIDRRQFVVNPRHRFPGGFVFAVRRIKHVAITHHGQPRRYRNFSQVGPAAGGDPQASDGLVQRLGLAFQRAGPLGDVGRDIAEPVGGGQRESNVGDRIRLLGLRGAVARLAQGPGGGLGILELGFPLGNKRPAVVRKLLDRFALERRRQKICELRRIAAQFGFRHPLARSSHQLSPLGLPLRAIGIVFFDDGARLRQLLDILAPCQDGFVHRYVRKALLQFRDSGGDVVDIFAGILAVVLRFDPPLGKFGSQ